jgi:hypothetical protein
MSVNRTTPHPAPCCDRGKVGADTDGDGAPGGPGLGFARAPLCARFVPKARVPAVARPATALSPPNVFRTMPGSEIIVSPGDGTLVAHGCHRTAQYKCTNRGWSYYYNRGTVCSRVTPR